MSKRFATLKKEAETLKKATHKHDSLPSVEERLRREAHGNNSDDDEEQENALPKKKT